MIHRRRRARTVFGLQSSVFGLFLWSSVFGLLLTGCTASSRGEGGRALGEATAAGGGLGPLAARNNVLRWPVYRGNTNSTGATSIRLPAGFPVLWKHRVENGAFEATPVVDEERVYIGDADGTLFALDFDTGDVQWKFTTELGFVSAPALRDGLVYQGDLDGHFFCLDAVRGEKRWEFSAEAEISGGPNFHGPNVLFGSQDATLYCLNAGTGDVVWKHTIDDQIRCSPTIVEGRAFLAGCDGKLHIIDVERGEPVGHVDIGAPTGSTPAALGDLVFFGTEGGTFLGVDWKKSQLIWKFQSDRGQSFRASAAVTENRVVFGGRDKQLYAADPRTGDILWKFATRGRIDSSPIIAGPHVVFGSSDGRLYALDVQTGETAWEPYDAGGGFIGSPAVAKGRLVIGNEDGTLYCFGAKEAG